MLFLRPKPKTRPRRLRRRRVARLLFLLFVFFGLVSASPPPEHALMVEVDRLTAPYQFDFVDWESRAITSEIKRRLFPPPLPADYAGQRALVDEFLDDQHQIEDLEGQIVKFYALSATPDEASSLSQQELAAMRQKQRQILPQVETLLAGQVEAILKDEGFVTAGQVLPPVAFRFIDTPTGLVLSPRSMIKNEHFVGLKPGLDTPLRAQLEAALDQRGDVSSYITDVGGLGSYPTMVVTYGYLPYLTEVIAHEWTHNYLFTFPTNIAWGYQTYPRLITINETTADLVGKEIGRKVIARFYPDLLDRLPPLDEGGQPAPSEPSEFDLAMRRIRLEVDQLLSEGKISQAESFMEAERVKLVKQGYNLRKLNQAYFAFHGSYALSPGSVDPIGPQLRQLRAASPSLKAFVDTIGWLNSYQDYVNRLVKAGISLDNHQAE